MAWHGMVWHGMAWYGMVWYGMVWYDMIWYGMIWYGMVWTAWYDMVWYGMIWYGTVRYGMVWTIGLLALFIFNILLQFYFNTPGRGHVKFVKVLSTPTTRRNFRNWKFHRTEGRTSRRIITYNLSRTQYSKQ
jgi:hypothetical protein